MLKQVDEEDVGRRERREERLKTIDKSFEFDNTLIYFAGLGFPPLPRKHGEIGTVFVCVYS